MKRFGTLFLIFLVSLQAHSQTTVNTDGTYKFRPAAYHNLATDVPFVAGEIVALVSIDG